MLSKNIDIDWLRVIKGKLRSTSKWVKTHTRLHVIVAVAVFLVGLCGTIYYWHNLRRGVQSDIEAAYTRQLRTFGAIASARIELYENFLRGSASLFAIHDGTTQADWEKYHQPYGIRQKFRDIENIGIARYLTKAEAAAFIEQRIARGDTNYAIFPEGERDVYVPVVLNAHYTGDDSKSQGYDGYADPMRRDAMDRAILSGNPAMSGAVSASNEAHNEHAYSVMYFPIYRQGSSLRTEQERKEAIVGFAYITINLHTLLDEIIKIGQSNHVALKVHDNITGKLVYQSANFQTITAVKDSQTDTSVIRLYGQPWRITFAVSPNILSERELQLPGRALWQGLLICMFLGALVWYLTTNRERTYARQKQQEVQTAKDDLLSLASHQLRTPATVVKQYIGMVLQGYGGKINKQQTHMLTQAYQNNERQLEIINQLLYVARLDAGRITLRKEKTNVAALLREVIHDHNQALRQRKHKLVRELPKRPLYAVIDPRYMRMAFENLMSNAIKYTPEGGVVTLRAQRSQNEITVSVSDTGVGISADAQQIIFEKFSRVENELSNDVNGSGVGLYLTQQIIHLHKGTIEVESEPGKGSTFTIRIPYSTESAL